MFLPHNYLWGKISRGTKKSIASVYTFFKLHTETKINQLDLFILAYQDILQFNIPVRDILRVEIGDCTYDLFKDYSSYFFADFSTWFFF